MGRRDGKNRDMCGERRVKWKGMNELVGTGKKVTKRSGRREVVRGGEGVEKMEVSARLLLGKNKGDSEVAKRNVCVQ